MQECVSNELNECSFQTTHILLDMHSIPKRILRYPLSLWSSNCFIAQLSVKMRLKNGNGNCCLSLQKSAHIHFFVFVKKSCRQAGSDHTNKRMCGLCYMPWLVKIGRNLKERMCVWVCLSACVRVGASARSCLHPMYGLRGHCCTYLVHSTHMFALFLCRYTDVSVTH